MHPIRDTDCHPGCLGIGLAVELIPTDAGFEQERPEQKGVERYSDVVTVEKTNIGLES